jgi:sulfite reductase (NADPH) flavoprotein alpha-component
MNAEEHGALIPDSAPFTPAQRAWLNGFFAGLFGEGKDLPGAPAAASQPPPEELPWHDPTIGLQERLALAAGHSLEHRLMAAMAQLDCGQCGYVCHSYAQALAAGRETSTGLCVPGAKPTQRQVKAILAATPAPHAHEVAVSPAPAKLRTWPARIVSATRLTAAQSAKDVRHVVVDLGVGGPAYEAGDSLGIAPRNDAALVEATLAALGATGCEEFRGRSVREALSSSLDIARPLDRTLDLLAMAATDRGQAARLRALSDGESSAEPDRADLLDLLQTFSSARPPLADLLASLPSLKPRLYSIASSPRVAPGEVHLCVGVPRAMLRGRVRPGVASAFLTGPAIGGAPVQVSIARSSFRLPSDPSRAIIMCGPGTGIAPFRAFLQERAATGACGPAWLFCGGQHEAADFLYRDELRAWHTSGVLTRLNTAFSRDQARKIYVQHRMLENAADLWRWLKDGSHVYVCGDATRMAKDVDAALRHVAQMQGGLDADAARNWIASLARQGRYLRDVY